MLKKIMMSLLLMVLTSIPCMALSAENEKLMNLYEQYQAEKTNVQDEIFELTKAEIYQITSDCRHANTKKRAPTSIVIGIIVIVLSLWDILSKDDDTKTKGLAGVLLIFGIILGGSGLLHYNSEDVIVHEQLEDSDTYQKYLSERLQKNEKYLDCMNQLEKIEMKEVDLERKLLLTIETPSAKEILVVKQKNAALKAENYSMVQKANQDMSSSSSEIRINWTSVFAIVVFFFFVNVVVSLKLKPIVIYAIEFVGTFIIIGCCVKGNDLANQKYEREFGVKKEVSTFGKEILFKEIAHQNLIKENRQYQINQREIYLTEAQIRSFYK